MPMNKGILFKGDGQEYAQVFRMVGLCIDRWEAMCVDGTICLARVIGRMNMDLYITIGDIILVGPRDQDATADVIHSYGPDEAKLLKASGEVPESWRILEDITYELPDADDIEFDD